MQLKEFKEQHTKETIQQKQKAIDDEKKLYPVFNPHNLIANTASTSVPTNEVNSSMSRKSSNAIPIPEAICVVHASPSATSLTGTTPTKVIRKTKHRSNTLDHKVAHKVDLID